MYPPSNNNFNCSQILSSSFHIPSPSMQYEHELFFQSYHDQYFLQQQQQVSLIADLGQSFNILGDSTETVTNPSNCTDNVKILNYNTETVTSCNHNPVLEGIEEEGGGVVEGGGNKGDDVMSSRTSIICGRISKNKGSSNKDRHSKINTARGPRDRRMRLSLDAARKFFSLQDLLGFDKASKTVEWLLIKSESAIEDLAAKGINEGTQLPHINKQISCSTTTTTTTTTGIGAICASNSISECEVVSGTDETSSNIKNKETAKGEKKKRKKKGKTARRVAFEPLARESRDQARARARERTKTKKICLIDKSKALSNKTCEEQQLELPTFHQEKQLLLGTKENSVDNYNLVVSGNWNPLISISNYQQNPVISHEHQFTDFQFCGGKLWEA